MISPKHAADLAAYAHKTTQTNVAAQVDEIEVYIPNATEIAQGVILHTRAGHQIGNAIVVQKVGQTRDWLKIRDAAITGKSLPDGLPMLDVWLIETDFGNQARLTPPEIHTMFTLGRKSTYPRWFDDRLELIAKRTAEL